MKRRGAGLVIASFAVLSIVSLFGNCVVLAAEDEIARYEKSLSNAKKEVEDYRKRLLNSPIIEGIKKEMASMDMASKAKDKELTAMLDSRLNKNPAYAELESRARELGSIEPEIRKYRAAIDSSPEVVSLKREAADLRARAQAKEQEARRITDSKFTTDQRVKDLLSRKEAAAKAQREAAELKKNVMNDAQVKALNTGLAELKKALAARNSQLSSTAEKLLKTDVRLKALELRIAELNKKIGELRKIQRSQGKAARPATMSPAKQAAPPKEGLIDRIKKRMQKTPSVR